MLKRTFERREKILNCACMYVGCVCGLCVCACMWAVCGGGVSVVHVCVCIEAETVHTHISCKGQPRLAPFSSHQ